MLNRVPKLIMCCLSKQQNTFFFWFKGLVSRYQLILRYMYFMLWCKESVFFPVLFDCSSIEQCFFCSDNFFPCKCLIWGCHLTSFSVQGTSTSHAVQCTFYMVFCFHKKLMNMSFWDSLEMVYLMWCFCSRYSPFQKLLLLQFLQLFLSDTQGSTGKDMEYTGSFQCQNDSNRSYLFFALTFNRKKSSKFRLVAATSLGHE